MLIRKIHNHLFPVVQMISQPKTHLHSPAVLHQRPLASSIASPSKLTLKIIRFYASRLVVCNRCNVSGSKSISPKASAKFSRTAKIKAQHALFDYLHFTRSVPFADAEHISKNSPKFVHKLLLELDDGVEVRRSMIKFLRYHPINEFEPFLESMGLNPSEVSSAVPRDMNFLTEDRLLLENYHVLCFYGIPRIKIGKIYKESREIFGYAYGVLNKKLRAYENLGLTQSTVAKLVTFSPSLVIGDVNGHFVEVFEKFKKIGVWDRFIGGFLPEPRKFDWKRVLDTMEALGTVGYSEIQMTSLLEQNPTLMWDCSGKELSLLVGELVKLGLDIDQISLLCCDNPLVSSRIFVSNLLQALHFLSVIGMDADDICAIVSSNFEHLGSHFLKQAKAVMSQMGVQKEELCQILKEDTLELSGYAAKLKSQVRSVAQDPCRHNEKIAFLSKLGYHVNSEEMVKALKRFRGRGDQLQERFDSLVEAGLDSEVVINMIKQFPNLLNQTKDVLQRKIECLRTSLGYPLESIIPFPSYLGYGLERISVRFTMYAWLREQNMIKREQNMIKPEISLSTLLACSEARFVKYFVNVHPEGPAFWETLKKSPVAL